MITIHIRRYRAKIQIIGDKIIEEDQRSISSYTEKRDTNGVSDIATFRQEFIVEMGQKIYNQNKAAELRAIQDRASTIEKVIIYNVS